MKRVRHLAMWTLWTAAHTAGIYWGVYGGVEWAANLLRFAVWAFLAFVVVFGPALVLLATFGRLDKPLDAPTPPVKIDFGIDVVLTIALAAGGWAWTAGAYLAKSAAGHFFYALARDVQADSTTPETETED